MCWFVIISQLLQRLSCGIKSVFDSFADVQNTFICVSVHREAPTGASCQEQDPSIQVLHLVLYVLVLLGKTFAESFGIFLEFFIAGISVAGKLVFLGLDKTAEPLEVALGGLVNDINDSWVFQVRH